MAQKRLRTIVLQYVVWTVVTETSLVFIYVISCNYWGGYHEDCMKLSLLKYLKFNIIIIIKIEEKKKTCLFWWIPLCLLVKLIHMCMQFNKKCPLISRFHMPIIIGSLWRHWFIWFNQLKILLNEAPFTTVICRFDHLLWTDDLIVLNSTTVFSNVPCMVVLMHQEKKGDSSSSSSSVSLKHCIHSAASGEKQVRVILNGAFQPMTTVLMFSVALEGSMKKIINWVWVGQDAVSE